MSLLRRYRGFQALVIAIEGCIGLAVGKSNLGRGSYDSYRRRYQQYLGRLVYSRWRSRRRPNTGGIALITAILNHSWKREEEQQTFARELTKDLRTKRQSAYQEYWVSFTALNTRQDALRRAIVEGEPPNNDVIRVAAESEESAFSDWWKNRIVVWLIGGGDVRKAIDRHTGAVMSVRHDVRQEPGTVPPMKEVDQTGDELADAMRKEVT